MKLRWLFLGIVAVAGVLVIGQFWHPSLTDSICILFVILMFTLSHCAGQMNSRLDRIETEMMNRSRAPDPAPRGNGGGGFEEVGEGLKNQIENSSYGLRDAVLENATELRTHLDGKLEEAEKDLEWRLGNLKIDLENLEKSLGWQIKTSLNDPRQELAEITSRLAGLERSFEEHELQMGWQLECLRRLHQISDGTRELRASAATAPFSSEGESKKEETARSMTMYLLGCIQQEVESFILPFFEGGHLSVLSMRLEKIQEIVREATLTSPPTMSREQIEREARRVLQELDGIHAWAKAIEDEETAKETAKPHNKKNDSGRM
jgi:hypothetical protein